MSRILLAVSGGVDSMYMLARSSELFPGSEVAVAHCNFGLRGDESDGDEEFVRSWCAAHGIRCYVRRFDTLDYASARHISVEMAARDLRYAWFAELLNGAAGDEAGASGAAAGAGFDAVAVAHNADDNAETLLLNLLRGTGTRGLRGMGSRRLPSGDGHGVAGCDGRGVAGGGLVLRPLLGISRAEIEAWMKSHGVPHREDSTNASEVYKRNKIRHSVFPVFAEINPSFVRTLNADMRHFAQADAIVDDYFRRAKAEIVSEDGTISVDKLLGFEHWEYLFFRLAEPCGFSEKTLESMVALLYERAEGFPCTFAGKRFYSPTHVLETSSSGMTIRPRDEKADSDSSVTVFGPGDYYFKGRTVSIGFIEPESLKQDEGVLICDASALPFPFMLRGWQAGDWMRPFGMGGRAKKLSDIFTDRKMSLSDKESAIIVYSTSLDDTGDGRVAAVAGLRMDEALRVREGSAKVLRISVL